MWIIKPNLPEDWNHNLIRINEGKRDTSEFIEACLKAPYIKSELVDSNDESIKVIYEKLEINSEMLINTLTVYEDKDIVIQYCYQQDYYQYHKPTDGASCYNYFSSIINNQTENVYGNAVFFQINKEDKKLMDLNPETLLELLASLYYVRAFQVRNESINEITFPNDKKYISEMMKDKNNHVIDNWVFYLDKNANGDITDLGMELVNMKDYNGLIIMRQKDGNDITMQMVMEGKIKYDDSFMKGVYIDINKKYVEKFFMRSK